MSYANKKWSRRSIVRALAALGLTQAAGLPSRALGNPAPRRRRHLINIQGMGGVDTCWTWSPVREADAAGLADKAGNFYGYYGGAFGSSYDPAKVYPAGNSVRYHDQDLIQHDGRWLGPVMNMFTAEDLNRFFIWRGVRVDGSHGVGNRLVQNGHPSPYAIGYALIVADHLLQTPDYQRPLHYVQVTASPEAFFTQTIMYKGKAAPVNLPDYAAWLELTATIDKDLMGQAQHSASFEDAIDGLSHQQQRFEAQNSYQLASSTFYSAFVEAQKLLGHNYARSPLYGFSEIMAVYKDAIVDDFYNLYMTVPSVKMTLRNHGALANLTSKAQVVAYLGSSLDRNAFNFALAEFLVKEDLSAVVDLPTASGDHHTNNIADLVDSIVSLSSLKTLLRRLAATEVPDGSGQSLFDVTTVALTTEFDRTIPRGLENPGSTNPGAGHGGTATFVLAGAGVNGGKVRGERMTASGGGLGHLTGIGYGGPVPLNPATGEPDAGGLTFGQRSLLPVVLAIFGAPTPPQQESGEIVFAPAVKPGHMG